MIDVLVSSVGDPCADTNVVKLQHALEMVVCFPTMDEKMREE